MANATRIADRARGGMVFQYTGTTAAQNIHLGFKPAMMIIYQETDADGPVCIWSKTSTADYIKMTTDVATETAVVAQVDNGTVIGFSLATDAVLNENTKVYSGIAFPE